MMTQAQVGMYRGLWADARAVLRASGLTPAECETRRHAIHEAVCGKPKSSLKLSNAELDKVKAAFLAISQPANVDAQMVNGDATRCWHVIGELCARIDGADEDYLQGVVDRMQREGNLRPGKRDVHLGELQPAELEKLIVALKLQVARQEERAVRGEDTRPAAALRQELLFA